MKAKEVLEGRLIPVFPLPTVVLFPRIVLPLHVFEDRYRKMLADVLDSHGRIAVALLKAGWEADYYGSPDVHAIVGVGNVVTYRRRDDGTSDVVLLGECRALVREWSGGDGPYRSARLEQLADVAPKGLAHIKALRHDLVGVFHSLTKNAERNSDLERLEKILGAEKDAGFLVDFLGYHFLSLVPDKQRLLEELRVEDRAAMLRDALRSRGLAPS